MYIKKDTVVPYMIVTITLALKVSSLLVFCMLYAGKKPSHKQHCVQTFLQKQTYMPVTYKHGGPIS